MQVIKPAPYVDNQTSEIDSLHSRIAKMTDHIKWCKGTITLMETDILCYSKATKARIENVINDIEKRFGLCYARRLRVRLKRDLVQAIVNLCKHLIDAYKTLIEGVQQTIKARRTFIERCIQSKKNELLAKRVLPFKKEYVSGFDDPSEGVEAWDALIGLIEDGTVKEADLPEYGIEL